MAQPRDRFSSRIGPTDATPLSIKDLPPPNTKRWVIRRKAQVVVGIRGGLITLEEACKRYALSIEELLSWQHLVDNYGLQGLRATKIQNYRQSSRRTD